MSLILQDCNHAVLKNIAFTVQPGEWMVIAGPTGAGKTTLLKMIAGLIPVSSGKIWLFGQDITQLPSHQRKIAMLFQNHALFPYRNVQENIAFVLQKQHWPKVKIKARVEQIAETVGCVHLLARYPETLSGGEQQRVALAQILACAPRVLLMDEPLAHLDAPTQETIKTEIQNMVQSLQIPVVYVTHHQAEAMSLGHRLGILMNGRLLQLDSPKVIYQKPASIPIAQFLGIPSINLVSGQVNQGYFQAQDWPAIQCPLNLKPGPTILGFRPEHIQVASSDTKFPLHHINLTAKVEKIEYYGHEQIFSLRCGAWLLRARFAYSMAAQSGTIVIDLDLSNAVWVSSS